MLSPQLISAAIHQGLSLRSLRCAYQAKVMKTFDAAKSSAACITTGRLFNPNIRASVWLARYSGQASLQLCRGRECSSPVQFRQRRQYKCAVIHAWVGRVSVSVLWVSIAMQQQVDQAYVPRWECYAGGQSVVQWQTVVQAFRALNSVSSTSTALMKSGWFFETNRGGAIQRGDGNNWRQRGSAEIAATALCIVSSGLPRLAPRAM